MDKKISEKLKALQASFLKKLPNKISIIEEQWRDTSINFDKEHLINFHRLVHTFRGSLETYGYTGLFEAFRDLEIYLKQLLEFRQLTATHHSDIAHLVERAKDVFYAKESIAEGTLESFSQIMSSTLIIYLAYQTGEFHRALKERLQHQGFQLLLLTSLADFQKTINKKLPVGIILDEHYLNDAHINKIANFSHKYEAPICCITRNEDISLRLKAIRIGVSIFFNPSSDVNYIAMQLIKRCALVGKEDYRILILEDSKPLADYYAILLQEVGMHVKTLTDPMMLTQTLQEFNPNILIMDLYLPGCTGFELAMLIRQEESYVSLPIIFISTEDDRYKQLAILNGCGGDDFLTKPILPANLVAAVKSRAQRAALLNSYIIHDPLTKLLNHSYILRQLDTEILRAKRKEVTISVAMIDLDYFKQINDENGHPMGDIALKRIAEILMMRVRRTDFVGRYGGDEFAIIFPDTSKENALRVCEEILEKIRSYSFNTGGNEFHVTLSMGIASYPAYDTSNRLIAAADQALYVAKSNGRNRVEVA